MASPVLMICTVLTVVDGDTVKCDGVNLRPMGDGSPYVSGFDTPEAPRYAKCPEESRLGILAMARLQELLDQPGLSIEDSGEKDRHGRPLVTLRLANGKTIGQTLIDEGHARKWTPDYRPDWCSE